MSRTKLTGNSIAAGAINSNTFFGADVVSPHAVANTSTYSVAELLVGGKILLDNVGKVGIGTVTPASYDSSADNLVVYESGHAGITIAANTAGNGSIYFADGTAGTTPYRGVIQYGHSADYMRFLTAATERIRINNTGKVGIGTTSPTKPLHVYSGENVLARFSSSDADALIEFDDNSTSDTILLGAIGNNLLFRTDAGTIDFKVTNNTLTALQISNAGSATFARDLAVSTTLPTIAGETGTLVIGDSGAIVTFDGETNYAQNAYYNSGWKYRTTDTASILQMGNGDIPFRFSYAASGSADAAVTFTEAMQISAAGNLGIGIAPDAWTALKVSDAGNVYANIYAATGYLAELQLQSQNASGLLFARIDNNGVGYFGTNIATDLLLYTNNSEKMRVLSRGDVAIGTTGPRIHTATYGTSATYLTITDATHAGVLELGRDTNANDYSVGGIQFFNHNNADAANHDADGKVIGAIRVNTVTSDTNAGDDSGGNIIFDTKPEAGSLAERMRITSAGAVTLTGGIGVLSATGSDSTGSTGVKLPNEKYIAWHDSGASGNTNTHIRSNANFLELTSSKFNFVTGKVGIGISAPTAALHVYTEGSNYTHGAYLLVESANASMGGNAVFAGLKHAAAIGASYIPLKVTTAGTTLMQLGSAGQLGVGEASVTPANRSPLYHFTHDTDTGMDWVAANTLTFRTGNTERLRIASAGQFGIGGANYGTDGQVLTSQGASAAPAWEDAGGGAWTLIGTQTASTSASLTQTGIDATYATYCIILEDFHPSADNGTIMFRLGDSSGIDSTSGDYDVIYDAGVENDAFGADNSRTYNFEHADSGIKAISGMIGSNTGEGASVVAYLHNARGTSMYPTVTGRGYMINQNGNGETVEFWGHRTSMITTDRILVEFEGSTTIVTGRMTVWGISHA